MAPIVELRLQEGCTPVKALTHRQPRFLSDIQEACEDDDSSSDDSGSEVGLVTYLGGLFGHQPLPSRQPFCSMLST